MSEIVTIHKVRATKDPKGDYAYLVFLEVKESLKLSITNAMTLCELFGSEASNWEGKKIELYDQPITFENGEVRFGKRIRAVKE